MHRIGDRLVEAVGDAEYPRDMTACGISRAPEHCAPQERSRWFGKVNRHLSGVCEVREDRHITCPAALLGVVNSTIGFSFETAVLEQRPK